MQYIASDRSFPGLSGMIDHLQKVDRDLSGMIDHPQKVDRDSFGMIDHPQEVDRDLFGMIDHLQEVDRDPFGMIDHLRQLVPDLFGHSECLRSDEQNTRRDEPARGLQEPGGAGAHRDKCSSSAPRPIRGDRCFQGPMR